MSALASTYREHASRIRASLIRVTRDFDVAEDALHDAFADAAAQWELAGQPDDPVAWLLRVARNKAIDRIRRRQLARDKRTALVVHPEEAITEQPDLDRQRLDDDTLRLLFTCCHPALPLEGQIALTLRVVAGLTTEEIARAFLVGEPTMAQRLVRVKTKIQNAGIAYRIPDDAELPERVDAILSVIYLVFTEGYGATTGVDLVRDDLCHEAIRLARLVAALLPDRNECFGLLALLLLTHARRGARVDDRGDLVLLEDQDRSRWDRVSIDEGLALLDHLAERRALDPYTLQAAIAGVHAEARDAADTRWRDVVALYDQLMRVAPTPVVALNRGAAIAMLHGPRRGLEVLAPLETELATFALFHAARADLYRRLGEDTEARVAYQQAARLTSNRAEARYYERRIAGLVKGSR